MAYIFIFTPLSNSYMLLLKSPAILLPVMPFLNVYTHCVPAMKWHVCCAMNMYEHMWLVGQRGAPDMTHGIASKYLNFISSS